MTIAKKILNEIDSKPLSYSLGKALRLSQQENSKDFERWCRLELGSYFSSNPAIDETVVVPEYRVVVGQYVDYHGRPLVLKDDLSFINETRLRNGVPELENLFDKHGTVTIQDPTMCSLIKQHLNVEVHTFKFSSSSILAILSSIKIQLSDWLMNFTDAIEEDHDPPNKDILELKPNFFGIGIDLKALWKKLKGRFRKK